MITGNSDASLIRVNRALVDAHCDMHGITTDSRSIRDLVWYDDLGYTDGPLYITSGSSDISEREIVKFYSEIGRGCVVLSGCGSYEKLHGRLEKRDGVINVIPGVLVTAAQRGEVIIISDSVGMPQKNCLYLKKWMENHNGYTSKGFRVIIISDSFFGDSKSEHINVLDWTVRTSH